MSYCYRTYALLFALTVWCSSHLSAQDSLAIRQLEPVMQNDSLGCRFAVPALFSGPIRQTLLSGLPVLVEQTTRIKGEKTSATVTATYRFTYDIWEDRFFLESARRRQSFASLTHLEQWWNPRAALTLLAIERLPREEPLQIELSLGVILLTGSQGQKLKDWILTANETEEELPNRERDTGFKLNLNQVVSLFLGKSDLIDRYVVTESSESFTIGSLIKPAAR